MPPHQRAIELFAVVQLLVVGLSHLLQPRAWVKFFTTLHAHGHAGVFVHGFLSLWFGALIVGFHNVWSGLPTVLTVTGWLYLVKAFACFLVPESQMRTLGRVRDERAWELRMPGVAYLVIAGAVAYSLWKT
jgi:hypothetical protein